MITTKQLETKRLVLRKVELSDASSLFNNWDSDIQMHEWVDYDLHSNIEDTKKLISKWIKEYNDGRLTWVIEEKSSQEVIGVVSASNKELNNKTSEIGFSLGTNFQGKGYASEALSKIINYLLFEGDLSVVKGGCYSYNSKSAHTMLKIGMKEQKSNDSNIRYFAITKEDLR